MSVVIAGYARTPFGRLGGALSSQSAMDLGAHAVTAALARAGLAPDQVGLLIAGQMLQAGAGQNPARQTAVAAGIPLTVPALTTNAVCLSGGEAIAQCAQRIASGEAEIAVAVGQESMSNAPHIVAMRGGVKYGAAALRDTAEVDGLSDAFSRESMGAMTERGTAELGLSRQDQDRTAVESHRRAYKSAEHLAREIAPFTVPSRRGDTVVTDDEGIRPDTSAESLARLSPVFTADGTITAGNSSPISDGAAAVVLVSESTARRLDLSPIARIEATAFVAGPDTQLHAQPVRAITAALARTPGLSVKDLRLLEINEAFAAVVLRTRELLEESAPSVTDFASRRNPQGGAIAIGHPIGASGTRIVGSLAMQLAELGAGSLGAAAICGGGGQGSALVLRAFGD